MLTTVTTNSPDACAAVRGAGIAALGDPKEAKSGKGLLGEFLAIALFSGIGLLVSLVAVFFGEQGVWP
jgi:hypothetical protein